LLPTIVVNDSFLKAIEGLTHDGLNGSDFVVFKASNSRSLRFLESVPLFWRMNSRRPPGGFDRLLQFRALTKGALPPRPESLFSQAAFFDRIASAAKRSGCNFWHD
jgi:hypothetical protein